MKKYLLSALALPLLFACSSDDLLEQEVINSDQFAGIEKVDATFSMEEGLTTRFDKGDGSWSTEEGDLWGFAWLGDGTKINPATEGIAYQNHNLIQTDGIFTPQTSIYVGKYFLYRPYDETTVSPQAINFTSLEEQTLQDGQTGQPWKSLGKTAINIGDKWTAVTTTGNTKVGSTLTWNKAGINQHYDIYAAVFSNQTGLDLTYKNNNVNFDGQAIAGATDINYTYPTGSTVGAVDIYDATVTLTGAAKSFTYAPKSEPNSSDHTGTYWADKENLGTDEGFNFTDGAITLTAADENGVSTDKADNKGWFWFNSLPVTNGSATDATQVTTAFTTSYGTVTVTKTIGDVAYEYNNFGTTENPNWEWVKLVSGTSDNLTASPKQWAIGTGAPAHNTFVNQYGNHHGKYAFEVDFSTGVMTGMHIKNDAHLQKALKYYIASGKTENPVILNLDEDADGNFKISKISIALLQTINASSTKVTVLACTTHGTPKIIVTQDGQAALSLADKTEVPALDKVFAAATDVYLSSEYEWTWAGGTDGKTALPIDANVSKLTNEGNLTVNATNVQLSVGTVMIYNAQGAKMDITKVTTVKNTLHNYGTINVGAADNTTAELRAYNARIYNNASALDAYGTINNYGVVGSTSGTSGEVNNYGLINMMNDGAMTLLKSNEKGTDPFASAFNASSNKMGTVVLPENNPTALVSVNNAAENGFIKYTWTGKTYATPEGNVKYNTIVVSDDITFTAAAPEIQYIQFQGTRTQVVNPAASDKLTNLKGIIVDAGKSIIIEKNNKIGCSVGAFLGTGATIYKGGTFTYPSGGTTNYFGTWSTDQIVVYGD